MLLQPADKRSHPMTDTKKYNKVWSKADYECVIVTSQGQSKRHDVFGLLPLHDIVPNAESFGFGRSEIC